jgi:hypothetical protein
VSSSIYVTINNEDKLRGASKGCDTTSRGHSRLGYSFWASNGKRTFLDNFTCLVCLDLYCETYFGAYLHFILHIVYTNEVNLEGIGSYKISF